MRNKWTWWGVACLVVGVALVIVTATLGHGDTWDRGPRSFDDLPSPGTATIERHFIEQMVPHHEDAVAMAELALTRAQRPEIKQLAEDIIVTQTQEIEQMREWYRAWYGLEAPEYDPRDGSWGRGMMGRGMMGGGMMGGGMMGGTDLEALEAASDFDREFIEQMIPHHQMGVMMARMVDVRSDRPEIDGLAAAIIKTQSAEIDQMRDWYRAWYE
jgi:uncharacterized protein (DUF305 family)